MRSPLANDTGVFLPGWEVEEDDHVVTLRCTVCGKAHVFSAVGVSWDVLRSVMRAHFSLHDLGR
jgi:hypothetical protein